MSKTKFIGTYVLSCYNGHRNVCSKSSRQRRIILLDAGTAKSKLTNFSGSGDFYIACTMWAVLGDTPRLDMRFILDFLNIL
ncbi:hypothetical protein OSO01_28320 [Oceanobacillus sojae]|uniref:Uncharacterized protein n=1 Tax=Oceanobacillus sojae TaxID=582851 RepID=A0A511ZKV4_9BACI|nr:hypothetical protein OSO01_28320 [Oceanobacillus sojae]